MAVAMEKPNEPCSPDALAALRRAAAAPLPQDYVAFLRRHDGGRPEDNVFAAGAQEAGVDAFLRARDVVARRDRLSDRFPAGALPIADASGGNYVLLRPDGGGGWRVLFWDHEEDDRVNEMAPSFSAFLDALRPFSQDDVKLDPKRVISAWIDPELLNSQNEASPAPARGGLLPRDEGGSRPTRATSSRTVRNQTSTLHSLSGHDNGLYFFYGRDDLRRCAVCGDLLAKWEEDLASVKQPRMPKLDVSASYDGVLVLSPRAQDVIAAAGLRGLGLRPLRSGFAAARPAREVRFDAARRGTRFEKRCDTCGRFGQIAGATPAYLLPGAEIAQGEFVRTDVEFGSNDEKHPLVVCGAAAAKTLKDARLTGLDLEPVRE